MQLEKKYKVPVFEHAYTKHKCHPLTKQYTDEAHRFLESHGVDKQLDETWPDFVRAEGPALMGHTFFDTEPREFLWLCKFSGWLFAMDTRLDEGEYSDNPEMFIPTVLGISLSILWNNPNDERLLQHVKPLYEDCITTNESRAVVEAFHQDLVHAKNKTRDLLDMEMTPIASAFRELWLEYCEAVPAEFILREAINIQEYVKGFIWEAKNRKAGHQIKTIEEYILMRRWASGVLQYVVCSDMLIARTMNVPHVPNDLFYGPEMQSLLLAINDMLAWHNDIYSFHKEVILADDTHNLVRVLCEERSCSSYTEGGEIVLQLVQGRIADMERAYEQLKAVASPEYYPAIDRYMTTCRNCVSGTHEWHSISPRYNIAATSM